MFNNNNAPGSGGLPGSTPSFGEIGKGNQATQPTTQPTAQTTNQSSNQPLPSLSNPKMNMFMKNP